MTGMYIALSILAVVALLLLAPVWLDFRYDNGLRVWAGISIFRIRLVPKKKQPDIQKAKKKDSKTHKAATPSEKNSYFQKLVQNKGFSSAVSEMATLTSQLLSSLAAALRRTKVKDFTLFLQVSGNDAAHTAVEYGAVCSAVYPVLGMASTMMHFDVPNVQIVANYGDEPWRARLSFRVRIRLVFLLWAAILFFTRYISHLKMDTQVNLKKGGC